MHTDVLHWLAAQLGPDADPVDLAQRYERLGSARAVADEMLHERIATLLAEPLRVTVNGVATIDHASNVAALERRLGQLSSQTAPDDGPVGAPEMILSVPLVARPRR
ncbi:hypothetical protein OTB20_25375 [Streptomyces sp. H27-H1]|uniref:hypothetical protein n=1 Tax=unclassified Streptomyces TaxID=2593676 RepID=UPI00226E6D5C|nr:MULTISPECIES: hypothetical protein [unclassified Streptomyces]MCY0929471.1 hypothetical protein [Streptomyces sp. H27-H1]MCY0938313.1 hypothetical protein [Streptomyces sp. H34-S4]